MPSRGGEEEANCRICYSEATSENALISPCVCAGSMKYIHTECLRTWRQYPDQYTKCPVCKTVYFRNVKLEDISFDPLHIHGETIIYLIFGGISLNLVTMGMPKDEQKFTGKFNLASLCMIGHIIYFMYYMLGYMALLMKVNNLYMYIEEAPQYALLPIIHVTALYNLREDPVVFIIPLVILTQTYYKYHEEILIKINERLNDEYQ